MNIKTNTLAVLSLLGFISFASAESVAPPEGRQVSPTGIKHSILVCGGLTAIFDEESRIVWQVPGHSRDGMVLPNGNVLVSIRREAVEYKKGTDTVVWSYRLDKRNRELGTVNRLPNGNTLVVERGALPRLLEIDPDGTIAVEVPLLPDTDDKHMQTRMARKRPNGNYLVPHLLAYKVKEYKPDGTVVREIKTDLERFGRRNPRNMPFTAILLPNGNILANLTNGEKSAEFDPDGNVVWHIDNSHVDGRFKDPCGGQRLPNGNTVFANYGERRHDKVKVFEVNREKEVVWEFFHPKVNAHEIHILTTNGKPVTPIMR